MLSLHGRSSVLWRRLAQTRPVLVCPRQEFSTRSEKSSALASVPPVSALGCRHACRKCIGAWYAGTSLARCEWIAALRSRECPPNPASGSVPPSVCCLDSRAHPLATTTWTSAGCRRCCSAPPRAGDNRCGLPGELSHRLPASNVCQSPACAGSL